MAASLPFAVVLLVAVVLAYRLAWRWLDRTEASLVGGDAQVVEAVHVHDVQIEKMQRQLNNLALAMGLRGDG